MCQAGINTANYKVAIHQLQALAKLLKTDCDQWAKLADVAHQEELSAKLKDAVEKTEEVSKALESAFEHVHEHVHGHDHVHIS